MIPQWALRQRFLDLQDFVQQQGLQSIASCQGSAWNATAVDTEMMIAASEVNSRMDRWARLSQRFSVTLPLTPYSGLNYTQTYETAEGKPIFCEPGPASRPRHEHEQEGRGYAQRPNPPKMSASVAISRVSLVGGLLL